MKQATALIGQVLVMASLAFALVQEPLAQEFPSRQIRVIVMASPGSNSDVMVRTMAPEMAKLLGQPLVLENMPGAGGILANRLVAKQSTPDGYTLLVSSSTVLTAPVFSKDLGFDFVKDLAPITVMAEGPIILVAPAVVPWANFGEMVAYARANTGKLNSGVNGPTDFTALFMHVIRQRFGLNIVDVPYKGAGGAIIPATIANEIQLAFGGETQVATAVGSNRLRVLAVSGKQRVAAFPNAPTFEELGVQGVDSTLTMLFAPAGTSGAILDKLQTAVVRTLLVPEVKDRIFKSTGLTVAGTSREALGQAVTDRLQRYFAVARAAGIQPE